MYVAQMDDSREIEAAGTVPHGPAAFLADARCSGGYRWASRRSPSPARCSADDRRLRTLRPARRSSAASTRHRRPLHDIESWTKLEDSEFDQILGLIAGFCVGGDVGRHHLTSFRAGEHRRHDGRGLRGPGSRRGRRARSSTAWCGRSAGSPGPPCPSVSTRCATASAPSCVELFEERLPAVARGLADSDEDLTTAVGLCRMILEGVVLTAGSTRLLDALGEAVGPDARHAQGPWNWCCRDGAGTSASAREPSRAPTSSTTTSKSSTRARERRGPRETSHLLQGHREGRPAPRSADSSPSGSSSGERHRDPPPRPLMEAYSCT